MNRYLRKFGRYALLALPLTIVFAVACGSDTVTTVIETVIVEREVQVEVTREVEKIVVATAAPSDAAAPARVDERFGGELRVALGAAITTLDIHRTTGTTAYEISFAVQERMLAYNRDLIATPLLMDSWTVSNDG
ncbi:MAG: hypothetical protein J4N79_04175, partial [Chloroflexi bacterium]|nr:hypothetical protein [Chloroflexota bacterium]